MRSLISIEFPVPEMEPESAHVASAVSVPYLQCGDCNPATQATFTNLEQRRPAHAKPDFN